MIERIRAARDAPERRCALALAILLACGATFAPSSAAADDIKDDARTQARNLAGQGDAEFSVGRCDKAVPLWRQADERFPAPTIKLRIARCEALLGHVVSATAILETILAAEPPAEASEAFQIAREQAARDLPAVRARVGHLRIELVRTIPGARIELDDSEIVANESLATDPGPHRVLVTARDASWVSNVDIEEGGEHVVRVDIVAEQPPRKAPLQQKIGYVVGAAGLGALAAGGILGATALSSSSSLDAVCGTGRTQCPTSSQEDIDSLKTRALAADITLAGGGALLLTGAILVLTASPPPSEEPKLRIVPLLGGLSVAGRF
jgi:hypothetical protein